MISCVKRDERFPSRDAGDLHSSNIYVGNLAGAIGERELIAHFLDAVFRDLGNMQQAVGAGEDLDERAEIDDAHYFAQIGLAHFGHRADIGDHLDATIGGGAVTAGD